MTNIIAKRLLGLHMYQPLQLCIEAISGLMASVLMKSALSSQLKQSFPLTRFLPTYRFPSPSGMCEQMSLKLPIRLSPSRIAHDLQRVVTLSVIRTFPLAHLG